MAITVTCTCALRLFLLVLGGAVAGLQSSAGMLFLNYECLLVVPRIIGPIFDAVDMHQVPFIDNPPGEVA